MATEDIDVEREAPGDEPVGGARRTIVIIAMIALFAVAGWLIYRWLDARVKDYDVLITPSSIPADGVSSAVLEIRLISRFDNQLDQSELPYAPTVEIVEGADLVRIMPLDDSLHYRLIAGFETGTVVARVKIWGSPGPIEARLELTPSYADRNGNGYPDVVDLTSESDRTAFRRWFTTIALSQLTHLDDRWHDRDCAGLLRYCFREALKRHDNGWLADRRWLANSAIPDVRKYNYPAVPMLGTSVFNAGTRPANESLTGDATAAGFTAAPAASAESKRSIGNDEFAEFAEASRLKDNSLAFVSRSRGDALPGDVIFYLNDTNSEWPYHTMIYLGGGETVYHTGPDGDDPGIVKQLSFQQLAAHPNPRWHPVATNPYFLGFYRWRILM